jgi:hypothetical protein
MNTNEHEALLDLQDPLALYLPFVNIRVHSWLKFLFLNTASLFFKIPLQSHPALL